MTYTFFIDTQAARAKAGDVVAKAPYGSIVTVRKASRSGEQNSKMWAMLTDVSLQCKLATKKEPPETWKAAFMQALNHEQRFVPALDGGSYIPLGTKTSRLSVGEMSELIEFIYAYGAEQNVEWSEKKG